ncbi:MAG: hypothetical protein HRT88_06465 [Lentisphaeraceae bacterium]|nr:hypothetical protein [Lentisphaeraceae bacterium]
MNTTTLLNEQIDNCRQLLKVFKDERESFSTNGDINLAYVMKSLQRKKEILKSFETQKQIMTSMRQSPIGETEEKTLLRELGSILEQLLVIDQENEVMLRDLLSHKPGKAKVTTNTAPENSNMRPRLPFCPGQNLAPKKQLQNNMASAAETTTITEKGNLFSRNRLKAYGI